MSVESVRAKLGSDAELFDVYEENGYIVAKPKAKIDSEDFKRIAKTQRQYDGEYVRYDYSTKKGGYFRYKKGEANKPTQDKFTLDRRIMDAKEYLKHALENLEEAGY